MFTSIAAGLLWFETGTWFGLGISKLASSGSKRILIEGSDVRTSIPIADSLLEKQTVGSTKTQRVIASNIAKMIRSVVNTKAFEQTILIQTRKSWPGQSEMSTEVKLFI